MSKVGATSTERSHTDPSLPRHVTPGKTRDQSTTTYASLGQSGSLQATEPQGGPDRTKPPHPPEFSSGDETARAPLHPLIDSSDRHLKRFFLSPRPGYCISASGFFRIQNLRLEKVEDQ
jgi:hypothetical protein